MVSIKGIPGTNKDDSLAFVPPPNGKDPTPPAPLSVKPPETSLVIQQTPGSQTKSISGVFNKYDLVKGYLSVTNPANPDDPI